ncbi:hypothetical protein BJP37_05380 [Moorena bouillonii PNG]|uniref:Uncharacterized protein n=1 Tax=Moorena bouillonii PNG TaxID=568701 RepID=A0A1U7MXY5_9CYAN|nr:hypothetical protein BJP37_05380 [Moorena bouillonii PNG]
MKVEGYRLQVTGYRLQVTGDAVEGYRLQVTGYRLLNFQTFNQTTYPSPNAKGEQPWPKATLREQPSTIQPSTKQPSNLQPNNLGQRPRYANNLTT